MAWLPASSGRVPAAFNSLVGLKPTRGLVSTEGVVPACRSLDCVSIFAKTCKEAFSILEIVKEGQQGIALPAAPRFAVPREPEFHGDREYQRLFEKAVARCPSVVHCLLMSGDDDYLLTVLARDIEDFEHIHKGQLSTLPRVARIHSSFAIREVINRPVPPTAIEHLRRAAR